MACQKVCKQGKDHIKAKVANYTSLINAPFSKKNVEILLLVGVTVLDFVG